ncbi:PspC domain-containing protein [Elizabethkingia argentiflava]|uniref:PspC domain-containing protein n=1 Tax=Elizabethkingia argenteiflava TaxID=2681556 RepID=A0A845PUQ2_9FLAO|nr:PspC domain-containing protein [Elizabethkingia argenteiflava]NAW51385.1 PspC domain-containing protein [Elizabethkingia argenteiflava]
MNKTLSIGLAGFSFIIEEHAYIKLNDYLSALQRSMEPDETQEIMQDIETRIVEIFKDRLGKREVVTDQDVEVVIALIGTPEQIDEQEQEYTSKEKINPSALSSRRQLFRDPETKKIGGVSGGLASYLGVDIVWIRLLFVALFFLRGFGLLAYIILWIVVPIAKTTSELLKMKGKPLNFDNLKGQSSKTSQTVQYSSGNTNKITSKQLEKAAKIVLKLIASVLGLCTTVLAVFFFLGSLAVLSGGFSFGSGAVDIPKNINFYFTDRMIGSSIIFVGFLSLFIPAIILTLVSLKLFSLNLKIKHTNYLIGMLVVSWIILLLFVSYSISKTNFRFNGYNQEIENISLNTKSDSIILDSKKVLIPENFEAYILDIYSDRKTIFKKDYPHIEIEKTRIKNPYLIIEKSANGYNKPLQMNVPVEVSQNRIIFPNYFSYSYGNRFRGYRVKYKLVVPDHVKITKFPGAHLSIEDEDNDFDEDDKSLNNLLNEDDIVESIILKDKEKNENIHQP